MGTWLALILCFVAGFILKEALEHDPPEETPVAPKVVTPEMRKKREEALEAVKAKLKEKMDKLKKDKEE